MTPPRIFGFAVTPMTADAVADHIRSAPRTGQTGVGLVVTPNIQHIAELRRTPAFQAAYSAAEIVTCDGFPVHAYARLRGCPSPERVTGCAIVANLMHAPWALAGQRLFFVVDSNETAEAASTWATANNLAVETAIPSFGFEDDASAGRALAARIAAHGTTLLFMGVGAPKSEVFVHAHRAHLPPCWALCIGQAVKIALGLVPQPPHWIKRANLEWAWRIVQEPKRLSRRYLVSSVGFLIAVAEDLRHGGTPR